MRDSASCSEALRELIDIGFQQAAVWLNEGSGPLAPFLIFDGSEGTQLYRPDQRLVTARAALRKHASKLPKDVTRCVIGYEELISDGGSRNLAVVMEGCERGSPQSAVFARTYVSRPDAETPKLSERAARVD